MSSLYPPLADQSRLHLDERYSTSPRVRRTPTHGPHHHRVARALRAVADRIDG